MKIEKRVYKVIFKGKRFSLPVHVSIGVRFRKKILVRRQKHA